MFRWAPGEVMAPWNEPEVKPVARFINRSTVKSLAQLRQASSRLLVGMVKFGNSVASPVQVHCEEEKKIRLAMDVSHPYATLIRRGVSILHPRHWMLLAELPGDRK